MTDGGDAGACRVCRQGTVVPFLRLDGMSYWRCPRCQATLLDPAHFLDPAAEEARYRLHRNDPDDPGYRAFLGALAEPLLARLAPGQIGLDYGCGPGPALAAMLRAAGHEVHLYDPFFFPKPTALARTYDFIVCTEAAEHFHHPHEELRRLDARLRPGGWLAVMTMFQSDDARFPAWHYRRDPTHVVFYREATFGVLAADFGWTCEIPRRNVVLLRK